MKRRILAQGDLDGACYLYSIANSVFALTSKRLTDAQWEKSLRALPFKLDDFLSRGGTKSLDDTPDYLESLCRNFLNEIKNTQFEITRNINISSKLLRSAIMDNQVAIVAIDDGKHWVSLVDADQKLFYLACSAAFGESTCSESKCSYSEQQSPNFHRVFNKTASFSELRIWKNNAFLIKNVVHVHPPT